MKRKGGRFGAKGDGDKKNEFYDPLSYRGLERWISENHPRDPDTKKPFGFTEGITVKDFYWKLASIGGCDKCS